jgi:hypothetical protein
MATQRRHIEKFGKTVIIDETHPLALKQDQLDKAEAAKKEQIAKENAAKKAAGASAGRSVSAPKGAGSGSDAAGNGNTPVGTGNDLNAGTVSGDKDADKLAQGGAPKDPAQDAPSA